jgi:hypothetical protein
MAEEEPFVSPPEMRERYREMAARGQAPALVGASGNGQAPDTGDSGASRPSVPAAPAQPTQAPQTPQDVPVEPARTDTPAAPAGAPAGPAEVPQTVNPQGATPVPVTKEEPPKDGEEEGNFVAPPEMRERFIQSVAKGSEDPQNLYLSGQVTDPNVVVKAIRAWDKNKAVAPPPTPGDVIEGAAARIPSLAMAPFQGIAALPQTFSNVGKSLGDVGALVQSGQHPVTSASVDAQAKRGLTTGDLTQDQYAQQQKTVAKLFDLEQQSATGRLSPQEFIKKRDAIVGPGSEQQTDRQQQASRELLSGFVGAGEDLGNAIVSGAAKLASLPVDPSNMAAPLGQLGINYLTGKGVQAPFVLNPQTQQALAQGKTPVQQALGATGGVNVPSPLDRSQMSDEELKANLDVLRNQTQEAQKTAEGKLAPEHEAVLAGMAGQGATPKSAEELAKEGLGPRPEAIEGAKTVANLAAMAVPLGPVEELGGALAGGALKTVGAGARIGGTAAEKLGEVAFKKLKYITGVPALVTAGIHAVQGDPQFLLHAADAAKDAFIAAGGSRVGGAGMRYMGNLLSDVGEAAATGNQRALGNYGLISQLAGRTGASAARTGATMGLLALPQARTPEDVLAAMGQGAAIGGLTGSIGAVPQSLRSTLFDHLFGGAKYDPKAEQTWINYGTDSGLDKQSNQMIDSAPASDQRMFNAMKQYGRGHFEAYYVDKPTFEDAVAKGAGLGGTSPDNVKAAGIAIKTGGGLYGDLPQIFIRQGKIDQALGHEVGHAFYNKLTPEQKQAALGAALEKNDPNDFTRRYVANATKDTKGGQITDASYDAIPTQAQVDAGAPKGPIGLTKEAIHEEMAAEHFGQLFKGQSPAQLTKNPSWQRSLRLGLGSALERMGMPTTTREALSYQGVQPSVTTTALLDKFLRQQIGKEPLSTFQSTTIPRRPATPATEAQPPPLPPDLAAAPKRGEPPAAPPQAPVSEPPKPPAPTEPAAEQPAPPPRPEAVTNDSVSALTGLGFKPAQAQNLVKNAEGSTVEEVVANALRSSQPQVNVTPPTAPPEAPRPAEPTAAETARVAAEPVTEAPQAAAPVPTPEAVPPPLAPSVRGQRASEVFPVAPLPQTGAAIGPEARGMRASEYFAQRRGETPAQTAEAQLSKANQNRTAVARALVQKAGWTQQEADYWTSPEAVKFADNINALYADAKRAREIYQQTQKATPPTAAAPPEVPAPRAEPVAAEPAPAQKSAAFPAPSPKEQAIAALSPQEKRLFQQSQTVTGDKITPEMTAAFHKYSEALGDAMDRQRAKPPETAQAAQAPAARPPNAYDALSADRIAVEEGPADDQGHLAEMYGFRAGEGTGYEQIAATRARHGQGSAEEVALVRRLLEGRGHAAGMDRFTDPGVRSIVMSMAHMRGEGGAQAIMNMAAGDQLHKSAHLSDAAVEAFNRMSPEEAQARLRQAREVYDISVYGGTTTHKGGIVGNWWEVYRGGLRPRYDREALQALAISRGEVSPEVKDTYERELAKTGGAKPRAVEAEPAQEEPAARPRIRAPKGAEPIMAQRESGFGRPTAAAEPGVTPAAGMQAGDVDAARQVARQTFEEQNRRFQTEANRGAALQEAETHAVMEAHAQTVPDNRVQLRVDPDTGRQVYAGDRLVTDDPAHQFLLQKVPQNQIDFADRVSTAIQNGTPIHADYLSAARESPGQIPTAESRRAEQAVSTPEARAAGTAASEPAGKTVIPTSIGVKVDPENGNRIYAHGVSPDKVVNNATHLSEALGQRSPYPDVTGPDFARDLGHYLDNQRNGYKGDGSVALQGTATVHVTVNPDYKPVRLEGDKADFINASFHNPGARAGTERGASMRELAEVNRGFVTPQGETNPLRERINNENLQHVAEGLWSKQKLQPAVETVRADLTRQLHDSPEAAAAKIRPSSHAVTRALEEHGLPRSAQVAAGFMPEAGGEEFVSPNVKEGTGIRDAFRMLASPEHRQARDYVDKVNTAIGNGPKSRDAIGWWEGTGEGSTITHDPHAGMETLRARAALKALHRAQLGTAVFGFDKAGPDVLHEFRFQGKTPEEIHALSTGAGFPAGTLEDLGNGQHQLTLIDPGGKNPEATKKLSEESVYHQFQLGTAAFDGGETRSKAADAYRGILDAFTGSRGDQGTAGPREDGGRGDHGLRQRVEPLRGEAERSFDSLKQASGQGAAFMPEVGDPQGERASPPGISYMPLEAEEKKSLKAPSSLRAISPERDRQIKDVQARAKAWLAQNPEHERSVSSHIEDKQKFPEKLSVEQLADYFEKRHTPLDLAKDDSRQKLADAATYDVMRALSKDGSAVGWYDDTVDKALRHVADRLDPSILHDPTNAMWFKLATAVTSQGQNVFDNFDSGFRAYQSWKKTGKLPTDPKVFGGGTKSQAMVKNFERLNQLRDQYGDQGLKKILETRISMRELKKEYGIDVAGESKGYQMEGAAMLGPKIGSFYNNLNKRFDSTTMDLWFSRTMRRMTGDIFAYSEPSFRKQLSTLQNHLEAGEVPGLFPKDATELSKQIDKALAVKEGALDRSRAMKVAPDLIDWADVTHREFAKKDPDTGKTYENRTTVNMLAKVIDQNLHMTDDKPRSSTEREQWRDVMDRVQNSLKAGGVQMTNADLQAVLWYCEKDLYKNAGASNVKAESADYLDAAHALAQKHAQDAAFMPDQAYAPVDRSRPFFARVPLPLPARRKDQEPVLAR